MKKIIKKNGLVIILGVVALIMAMVRYQYRNYQWPEATEKTLITPTIRPTSAPIIDVDYPLWKLLPYEGKGFTVERYIDSMTLSINLKGVSEKIALPQIYKWMEENRVATESHTLVINK